MKRILLLVFAILPGLISNAQIGSLDPAFGNNGIGIFNILPDMTGSVLKVLPAAAGNYYIIYAVENNGYQAITIGKYKADGSVETSYGTDGYSAMVVMNFTDAILQADEKIVVAGATSGDWYGDFHDDILVARFTVSGALDASFNNTGIVRKTYSSFSYEFTQSLTIVNNTIVVQGYSVSLVGRFAFYHIDMLDNAGAITGTIFLGDFISELDQFNPGDYNYSVAGQGDKLLVTAMVPDFTGYGNYFSLKRYLANGTPDTGFGTDGSTALGNDFFNGPAIVASQGNKIVVATYNLNTATGTYGFAIARYNNDGSFDNSFNGNGRQIIDFGEATPATPRVILARGDTLYIGGDKYNALTQKIDFALARLTDNGLPDNKFNGNGKQITGNSSYSFSLQKMAVNGNRLAVSGMAVSATRQLAAVAALYILESPVVLTAPADTTVNTDKSLCAAVVNGIGAKINGIENSADISYLLTGATIGSGTGPVSGHSFNKGVTQVTYTAISDTTKTAGFKVTVLDNEAPTITNITATPDSLWLPDHMMRSVQINYLVTDNCSLLNTTLTVTSNEPETSIENDDLPNDWIITDDHHIQLRAERLEKGSSRTYTINIKSTDAAGNSTAADVMVTVPKNKCGFIDCDDNEDASLKVKIFPNPTYNYFLFKTNSMSSKKLTLRVYNQLGRLIETKKNIPSNGSFQIGQNYTGGVYIAELTQGLQRIMLKLVKLQGATL